MVVFTGEWRKKLKVMSPQKNVQKSLKTIAIGIYKITQKKLITYIEFFTMTVCRQEILFIIHI